MVTFSINIYHKRVAKLDRLVPVENAQERIVVQADVHQANSSQCSVNPTSTTTTRSRKSCTQRCREYRQ